MIWQNENIYLLVNITFYLLRVIQGNTYTRNYYRSRYNGNFLPTSEHLEKGPSFWSTRYYWIWETAPPADESSSIWYVVSARPRRQAVVGRKVCSTSMQIVHEAAIDFSKATTLLKLPIVDYCHRKSCWPERIVAHNTKPKSNCTWS